MRAPFKPLAAFVLVASAFPALAGDIGNKPPVVTNTGPGQYSVTPSPVRSAAGAPEGRQFGQNSDGSVRVLDRVNLSGGSGIVVPAVLSATIAAAAVRPALAAGVGAILAAPPVVGIVAAAAIVTIAQELAANRIEPNGVGGLSFDTGVPQVAGPGYRVVTGSGSVVGRASSQQFACNAAKEAAGLPEDPAFWQVQNLRGDVVDNGTRCVLVWEHRPAGSTGAWSQTSATLGNLEAGSDVPLGCADSSTPGRDGMCSGGPIREPSSAEIIAALAQAASHGVRPQDEVELTLGAGGAIPTSGQEITGPSEVVGTPSTVTSQGADGSTKVETTTPAASITYGPSTVTINNNATTVTNVTNAAGVTTTTTTSTAQPAPAPAEASDLCKLHPGSSACAALGDPGTANPPGKTDVPVGWSEVAMPTAGGCPAPLQATIPGGRTVTLSYDAVCDAASSYVRPVLLLLAAVACVFIFVGGTKGNQS